MESTGRYCLTARPARANGLTTGLAPLILALSCLCIPDGSPAQGTPPQPYTLDGTTVHRVWSEVVGDTFSIVVALPPDYEPARALPLVVATDADLAFGALVQVARLMQWRSEMPPCLLVGIGYGDLGTALAKRRRDLTPTVRSGSTDCGAPPGCGGAARFATFIEDELLPFIAERYPVSDDRTFVGNSLGGLFGAFVLLHRPSLFQRYILGSPTVMWDDHRMIRRPPPHDWTVDAAVSAVFVGVGGAEPAAEAGARALVRILEERGAEDRVDLSIFEGEGHMSAQPMVVARGLRRVFQRSPPAGAR